MYYNISPSLSPYIYIYIHIWLPAGTKAHPKPPHVEEIMCWRSVPHDAIRCAPKEITRTRISEESRLVETTVT